MAVANESSVIAEAIQTIIGAMSEFDSASVFISSWDFLDRSEQAAPWVLIRQFGLVSSVEEMDCVTNTWTGLVGPIIPFFDWNQDELQIASLRDAILTEFNLKVNRNLALTDYFNLQTFSDLTPGDPILPDFDEGSGSEMPNILSIPMVFTVITRD
jgi:hypothetical protein